MAGYTPLFNSIVRSSIWDEDNATRIVWITMLALADADGIVEGSPKGLAHEARVALKECNTALEILKAPDPYSKTIENEGRRIREIEGGWIVINHSLYRKRAKSRAEYYRQYRKREKERTKEKEETNINSNSNRRNIVQQAQHVAHYSIKDCEDACILNEIPEINAESYFNQYSSQGWKKGNGQVITNLQAHMAKRWNKSKNCWDFDEKKGIETKLRPIVGKVCGVKGCGLPAFYKSAGEFDNYYCEEHMPEKVKKKYS